MHSSNLAYILSIIHERSSFVFASTHLITLFYLKTKANLHYCVLNFKEGIITELRIFRIAALNLFNIEGQKGNALNMSNNIYPHKLKY